MKRTHAACTLRLARVTVAAVALVGCTEDLPATQTPEALLEDGVSSTMQLLDTGHRFGTSCQESFEDGWIETLSQTWNLCSLWNTSMDEVAQREFYYNLHGAKSGYEQNGDGGRLELVDIHFNASHGGGSNTQAWFTMWDDPSPVDTRAYTTNMRLGDESVGLSVFFSHACDQGSLNASVNVARWTPVLRGGLRIAGAMHGSGWFGDGSTKKIGKYVADYMKDGQRITNSWGWGATNADSKNTPIIIATGSNATNCANRRDMTLTTFKSKPRLRDGAVGYYCWNYWN